MAIVRSQSISATASAVSSLNAVFSSAVTAGNFILVFSATFHSSGTVVALDNVNAGNYTAIRLSTNTGVSSGENLYSWYKNNLSSGGIASTYRVSVDYPQGVSGASFWAAEYSGLSAAGFDASSEASATSSNVTVSLTAASAPVVFLAAATAPGSNNFRSTNGGGFNQIALIDPTNANQTLAVAESSQASSVTVQNIFRLVSSTQWVTQIVSLLPPAAGGAATVNPWTFCLMGIQ